MTTWACGVGRDIKGNPNYLWYRNVTINVNVLPEFSNEDVFVMKHKLN
jgi:hypothetical protein